MNAAPPPSPHDHLPRKTVGRRGPTRGGIEAAAPFLRLVIELRRGKPLVPRGIYRFASFEEKEAWAKSMMTR